MYQYNDRLTQLFTKYKNVWLCLQCFYPYLGHRQAYIMNLGSLVHVYVYHASRYEVLHTYSPMKAEQTVLRNVDT
jgi:hypothetical protein